MIFLTFFVQEPLDNRKLEWVIWISMNHPSSARPLLASSLWNSRNNSELQLFFVCERNRRESALKRARNAGHDALTRSVNSCGFDELCGEEVGIFGV